MSTLHVAARDLHEIVRRVGIDALMDELTGRLASAIASFEPERTEIPLRTGFSYTTPTSGLIEWMPLMHRGERVLMKIVGYHPANGPRHGLPTILSTISLLDPETGHLTAVMDGTLLTAMRTGAASAVATRILASPDSRTLGLVGCGAQAVTQLHALSRVLDLTEVVIHDVDPAVAATFPARVSVFLDPSVAIRAAPVQEVIAGSDVVCVATSIDIGQGPVFADGDTRPWLHVNAVGSDFPGKVEIPATMLKTSFVVPDCLEQACREGECQQLEPHEIGATLVELVREPGDFAPQRATRTVFDSTGWALEDHVAVDLALRYATEFGLGSRIDIETTSVDPRHPYESLEAGKTVTIGDAAS